MGRTKGGCPTQVKRTRSEDDVGIIRIDYPGYSSMNRDELVRAISDREAKR